VKSSKKANFQTLVEGLTVSRGQLEVSLYKMYIRISRNLEAPKLYMRRAKSIVELYILMI
jgi:hypothetical protein